MSVENPTLGEAVAQYLTAAARKLTDLDRQELNNFIRWFGAGKPVATFKESDVADYSEGLSPSDTDYRDRVDAVKAFLSYARKEGWVSDNLAAKVKIKKAKSVTSKQPEQKKVPMTREGFERMQQELGELKEKRLKVIDDIRRAAADKDLRENAPYHAAREQKSHLDGRIMEIEETLKCAEIVEEKATDNLRVNVGNSVKIKDVDTGEEAVYTLVSPREVDPFEGKISNSSPVGKAVMGHSQGDTVEVMVPSGRKFHYCILEVNR